ncbi:uncharacterized protein BDZ99DRAFT_257188 [Mytilinidion resinicola]|uniref:BTB domain-containing protein n=1 Tax=Mytilinidion resinicola TaxID=574789 RepID=A0A6A6YXD9_9PEZI|nr:uncharacterized protein BDZ99DRAFT_257188 [Mytilinidion resinicola]KAF2813481.1 hypothetical protein BDZ99DRAFT_257188 [Mytilinidion resinicola]
MPSPEGIVLNVSGLLSSGEFSDLQIRCRDVTYKVHRVILCTQIKFFHNACSRGFKEQSDGVIDLSHDAPAAVKSMLQFAYTRDYTFLKAPDGMQALHHVKVYEIGHKYDVPCLQKLAKERFLDVTSGEWNKDWFPEVVRATYDCTPSSDRELPDALVQVMVACHSEISKQDCESSIQKLLMEGGEFSSDCFFALSKHATAHIHDFQVVDVCHHCNGKQLATSGFRKPKVLSDGESNIPELGYLHFRETSRCWCRYG